MRESATPQRSQSRRTARIIAWVIPGVLLLGAGGYVALAATVELPAPKLTELPAATSTISADTAAAQAAVDAQTLPTAIGWGDVDDDDIWANDDRSYSIASISKLVTVLVGFEAEPLAPGADGPSYTWTAADVAQQEHYLALDGVTFPIPEGTEVTRKQMLTLALLPSANDFADAYARAVFGDSDTFLAAVHDWAQRNHLSSLEFVEPTGMDEGNRANVSDLLRLGRLALANPTLIGFTSMASAVMPWGIGLIENTNPLITEYPGIIGLKTGRSESAGFNYLAAQQTNIAGRSAVKLSVTLARESLEARAQSGRDMLAALDTLPQHVDLVTANERIATLTGVDGATAELLTDDAASATLLPGETATRKVALAADARTAAQAPGKLIITTPDGDVTVTLRMHGELPNPDLLWRVLHPLELFGLR